MLSDYMRELEKIKLLTPEEEHELWRRYHEEGDEEARMSIIERWYFARPWSIVIW